MGFTRATCITVHTILRLPGKRLRRLIDGGVKWLTVDRGSAQLNSFEQQASMNDATTGLPNSQPSVPGRTGSRANETVLVQSQAFRTPAGLEGGRTAMRKFHQVWLPFVVVCLIPAAASAQTGGGSFRVQCPTTTIRHPGTTATGGTGTVVNPTPNSAEVPYTGPSVRTATKDPTGAYTFTPALAFTDNGGAIKCQQVSGGDGYMTAADGNQIFMFAFGPLSGLGLIQNGQAGTLFPDGFNKPYTAGDPAGNYLNGQPNPLYDG